MPARLQCDTDSLAWGTLSMLKMLQCFIGSRAWSGLERWKNAGCILRGTGMLHAYETGGLH